MGFFGKTKHGNFGSVDPYPYPTKERPKVPTQEEWEKIRRTTEECRQLTRETMRERFSNLHEDVREEILKLAAKDKAVAEYNEIKQIREYTQEYLDLSSQFEYIDNPFHYDRDTDILNYDELADAHLTKALEKTILKE